MPHKPVGYRSDNRICSEDKMIARLDELQVAVFSCKGGKFLGVLERDDMIILGMNDEKGPRADTGNDLLRI